MVYSGVHIDSEGTAIAPLITSGRYLKPRRGKVTEYLFYDNFVPFSSAIVRRKCFDVWVSLMNHWLWVLIGIVATDINTYKFDFCDEPFLLYRVGHSGQMSKNLLERIDVQIESSQNLQTNTQVFYLTR